MGEDVEPGQASRLAELYLQRDGIRAFERPEVATKLELSAEQKQRLQTLRETFVENRPRRSDPTQQHDQLYLLCQLENLLYSMVSSEYQDQLLDFLQYRYHQ